MCVRDMEKEQLLDIYSKDPYPSDVLSNFYKNAFELDGVVCASMEGFLQSLKTKNTALQKEICCLAGKEAKFFFENKMQNSLWKLTGVLYWQGKPIRRSSDEYQRLLDRAYEAMYACAPKFREALIASDGFKLIHTIGKSDSRKTILTEYEFVSRLEKYREKALRDER